MATFDNLLTLTDQESFSREELERWAEAASPQIRNLNDLLDKFALYLSQRFLEGSLDFEICNGALNQTMAVINFEAPDIFWTIYGAFEDFEVVENPDDAARQHIQKVFDKLSGD